MSLLAACQLQKLKHPYRDPSKKLLELAKQREEVRTAEVVWCQGRWAGSSRGRGRPGGGSLDHAARPGT